MIPRTIKTEISDEGAEITLMQNQDDLGKYFEIFVDGDDNIAGYHQSDSKTFKKLLKEYFPSFAAEVR